MAKLKDLKVTIGLSKKGLTKLNGDIRRMKGNFRRNFGEITAFAKNAALTIGTVLVGAIGSVIKASADMERLEVGFRSIAGGAENAGKMVARLNQFAISTPFQLEEISNAARQLLAVGTTEDQLSNRLRMLGDIAAASSNSIGDIAAVFAKVQAKGKVELENLNQLAERGVPIFKQLRQVTGDANMEFGAGSVSVAEFNAALQMMVEQGGFAQDSMLNLSETITGKLTTAFDTLKTGLADIGEETGLLDVVGAAITLFTIRLKKSFGLIGDTAKVVQEDVTALLKRYNEVTVASFDETERAIKSYIKELQVMRLGTREGTDDHKMLTRQIDLLESALQTLEYQLQSNADTQNDAALAFQAYNEAGLESTRIHPMLTAQIKDQVVSVEELKTAYEDLATLYESGRIDTSTLAAVPMDEEMPLDEPEISSMVDMTIEQMQRIEAASKLAAQAFTGFFTQAFTQLQQGTFNFEQYMSDLIKRMLTRLAAMIAAFAALSVLFPNAQVVKAGLGKFLAGGFGIPEFANGGLVSGATLAMVGEGPGTSLSNPEVIAPLDKLQQMMGGGNVTVTGRLDGRDILISSERAGFDRNRVRGF